MATRKRPKGIEDDLAKAILKLIRKGTPKALKKAEELKGIQRVYRDDASKTIAGKSALGREWNKKLGREFYAQQDLSKSKSVSQRLREESRLRGMDSKFKKVGKKESANETAAITSARLRAERKAASKQAGGKNSVDRVAARKRAAENRAKNAKPKKPRNPKK